MSTHLPKRRGPWGVLVIAVLLLPGLVWAADRHKSKLGQFNANDKTVEMFEAIDKGEIAVKLIPKDSTQCNVMIQNKTDKPLNVKLPEAFAGVPVLAQQANQGNQGAAQPVGGGMGGMGGGMGGMGGGMFNVPAEKVGQFKATTVCLEHGKPEPRAAIPYEVRPIETVSNKPGVREVCAMVGRGEIPQRAAQVAAWRLNNDMSMEQLASKQIRFADGTSRPYFSPQELRAGMQVVVRAAQMAQQQQQQKAQSPGETAGK